MAPVQRFFPFFLALVFVGLQIATLLHSAQFSFVSHEHDHQVSFSIENGLLGAPDRLANADPFERKERHFCDLELFCEKLDKAPDPAVSLSGVERDQIARVYGNTETLKEAIAAFKLPRGPPALILS